MLMYKSSNLENINYPENYRLFLAVNDPRDEEILAGKFRFCRSLSAVDEAGFFDI